MSVTGLFDMNMAENVDMLPWTVLGQSFRDLTVVCPLTRELLTYVMDAEVNWLVSTMSIKAANRFVLTCKESGLLVNEEFA